MARLTPREEARLHKYESLLEREPNALIFAPLASLYARRYEFQQAVEVLRRGLHVFPNYFSARVLLARCHIALDDFDGAAAELHQVLAADPYNISALGLLSDELRNRGRLAEARDHYLKILEIEPDNEEYAYKLELLNTLIEGSPFAGKPAEREPLAEAVPAPTAVPAAGVEPPAVPEEAEGVDELELEALTVAAAAEEPAEGEPAGEELATVTLAKIYEDQGLFLRAREILEKVMAREPENAAAREALAHLSDLIAGEESPTGASVIQLLQKVEAVTGLLERDELELWEEVSAGVEEALTDHEEITLAQAVAAAAGVRSFDDFVIREDRTASWELDVPDVAGEPGSAGADELWLELPLWSRLDLPTGVNVAEMAAPLAPGTGGTDEFDLASGAAAGVDEMETAATVPREEGARGGDDFVVDLKAELQAGREEEPPAAPAAEEFKVKPEHYQAREPLGLEREPFEKDEDFLSWLDSIRLKEL
jgi:tetratricopeptide (TPR) repeat protein